MKLKLAADTGGQDRRIGAQVGGLEQHVFLHDGLNQFIGSEMATFRLDDSANGPQRAFGRIRIRSALLRQKSPNPFVGQMAANNDFSDAKVVHGVLKDLLDFRTAFAVRGTTTPGHRQSSRGTERNSLSRLKFNEGSVQVINIASISGMVVNRDIGGRSYETAKAAVIHFTRATAAEMGDPTFRHYYHRQLFFVEMLKDIITIAYNRAVALGKRRPYDDLELTSALTDLTTEDNRELAQAARERVSRFFLEHTAAAMEAALRRVARA